VQAGTSVAAPYALNKAVKVVVYGGKGMAPTAIKACMIHGADPAGHDPLEVGWGLAQDAGPDPGIPGVSTHVFHGELARDSFFRAEWPLPAGGYKAGAGIKATFCFQPPVGRHHPSEYVRAALNIVFVPDRNAPAGPDGRPPSLPFFDCDRLPWEGNRHPESALWAPDKSNSNEFPGGILKAPCFDIRYVHRHSVKDTKPVRYALVVTVTER
jgi:hypothetical protein